MQAAVVVVIIVSLFSFFSLGVQTVADRLYNSFNFRDPRGGLAGRETFVSTPYTTATWLTRLTLS